MGTTCLLRGYELRVLPGLSLLESFRQVQYEVALFFQCPIGSLEGHRRELIQRHPQMAVSSIVGGLVSVVVLEALSGIRFSSAPKLFHLEAPVRHPLLEIVVVEGWVIFHVVIGCMLRHRV